MSESTSLRPEGLALEFLSIHVPEEKTDAYFICNFFMLSFALWELLGSFFLKKKKVLFLIMCRSRYTHVSEVSDSLGAREMIPWLRALPVLA